MAPEASSVTVSQQMRRPVAKGTFSTASTCQISWGWSAWETTTAALRRRRGQLTPARTKASWRLQIEGMPPSCTCLRSWSRINPAAQAGWSRLRSQAIRSSSWIRGGTGRPHER